MMSDIDVFQGVESYTFPPEIVDAFNKNVRYNNIPDEEKRTIHALSIIVDKQLTHRIPIWEHPEDAILGFYLTKEDIIHTTWRIFPRQTTYAETNYTDPADFEEVEDKLCELAWAEIERICRKRQDQILGGRTPKGHTIERRVIYCPSQPSYKFGIAPPEKGYALAICENHPKLKLTPGFMFHVAGFDKILLEIFGITSRPNWYKVVEKRRVDTTPTASEAPANSEA